MKHMKKLISMVCAITLLLAVDIPVANAAGGTEENPTVIKLIAGSTMVGHESGFFW